MTSCSYCGLPEMTPVGGYYAVDGSFYCQPGCEIQHLREMLARARDAAVHYATLADFHVPSFLRDPADVEGALRIRGVAVFDGPNAASVSPAQTRIEGLA